MTDLVKSLAPKILEEIKKANTILLHCHPKPDPDSVGGALAMMWALKSLGKQVTVIKGDSDMPSEFSRLPGFDQIVQKNISEINLATFDLFLIQDSGAPTMVSRLVPMHFPDHLVTIVIDHHASNEGYGKINLVDATYPANCQLIFDLLKIWKVEITPDIAMNLFMGIFTDTGGFRYRGVTKSTFEIATTLVGLAPGFSEVISSIQNATDPKQIAFEAIALTSVETFFHNKVAIAAVPFSVLQKNNIPSEFTSSDYVVHRLLSVKDWDIVIVATEESEGGVKMSLRSKNAENFDVSKIASILGGGGHRAASGGYVKMSLIEAKKALVEAIKKVYPTLE